MSNHVASLVRSRSIGLGFTAKAVLLLMADFSSDDGAGIWASKARMARELETTDRTIQRTIKALIDAGFLRQIGKRKVRNVETFEYQILCLTIEALPLSNPRGATERRGYTQDIGDGPTTSSPDTLSPPTQCHPAPDTPSGLPPTQCHPNPIRTPLEPGAGGSAYDREPEISDTTYREDILTACQVDPVSGLTGHGSAQLGTPAQMIEAIRWLTDLRLSQAEVTAEISRIMTRKRDGPPKSLGYFTGPMERLAADLVEARTKTIQPQTLKAIPGGRNDRREDQRRFSDALGETVRRVRSGEIDFGPDPSDPFAGG